MRVEYAGHWLTTRRQALWLCFLWMVMLAPAFASVVAHVPIKVTIPVGTLVAVPFLLFARAWRFLEAQEAEHTTPTPGMNFAFEMMAVVPMAMSAMTFALMLALR